MPFSPKPVNPEHTVNLTIPIPGALKNALIRTAAAAGESLQQHVNKLLENHVRAADGKPPLQDAQHDPMQPVLDYLNGKTTLMPCGKTACDPKPARYHGKNYCDICGIQITGTKWDRWGSNPRPTD
jgi:hypothetical protein